MELVGKLADYCLRHLGPYLEPDPSIDPMEEAKEQRKRQCRDPMLPGKDAGMKRNEEKDNATSRGKGQGANAYLGLLVAIVQVSR